MKWNSWFLESQQYNQHIGGYAEARNIPAIVDYVTTNSTFLSKYPFHVIGIFGRGWDDRETLTTSFIDEAPTLTNASRKVIVSNQEDFFQDFATTHGNAIPTYAASFGNEWELYSASMAELSARVKRSMEKLRGAEAMASLVSLKDSSFMNGRQSARDQAMINMGLYFEHDWTADGPVAKSARAAWQVRVEAAIASYVDTLHTDAATSLGHMIANPSPNRRFFVFNPLAWERTDVADYVYDPGGPFHVVEVTSGQEVPSQLVNIEVRVGSSLQSQKRVCILTTGVPSLGYKAYEIRTGSGTTFPSVITASGNTLENSLYKVVVSNHGAISSMLDKSHANRELVASLLNNLGGTATSGTVVIENSGPVSVTLKASSSSPLSHTSRITLFRDLDRVQIDNTITQNFSAEQRWGFHFNLSSPDVWHEEVGAVIRAKLLANNGHYSPRNARYDWLTLNHFVDMSGTGGAGVTLSNPDLYFMKLGNSGVSTLDTSTASLTVLAGGQVDGAAYGIASQNGETIFSQRFALRGHGGYQQVQAMRFALEHQNPLTTATIDGRAAVLPADSFSLISVSDPDVLLWALKPADDGPQNNLVFRLWNQKNADVNLAVSLPAGTISSAKSLTHIETELGSLSASAGTLPVSVKTQQMKTFSMVVALSGQPPNLLSPPTNLQVR